MTEGWRDIFADEPTEAGYVWLGRLGFPHVGFGYWSTEATDRFGEPIQGLHHLTSWTWDGRMDKPPTHWMPMVKPDAP